MATLRRIPAEALHISKPTNWLTSRFHFSFADYFDPSRTNFGVLRVVNDDLVKPHSGFPHHPHRDQEIFSYVIDGQLSHQDSAGHSESLGRGAVQYMSAGRGVYHSEMNEGDETCRFLQIWVTPERKSLPVQYGSHRFTELQRKNVLLPIIKGTGTSSSSNTAPITLNQDCNVFVSEFEHGVPITTEIGSDRQAYMVCIEGHINAEGTSNNSAPEVVNLAMRDAMEIQGPVQLKLTTEQDKAHMILIEMAKA